MLLLAVAGPDEYDILGIATVAGNVPLHLTERNARLVCELAGCSDVPVFAGSDKTMVRELVTADRTSSPQRPFGARIFRNAPDQGQHDAVRHDSCHQSKEPVGFGPKPE